MREQRCACNGVRKRGPLPHMWPLVYRLKGGLVLAHTRGAVMGWYLHLLRVRPGGGGFISTAGVGVARAQPRERCSASTTLLHLLFTCRYGQYAPRSASQPPLLCHDRQSKLRYGAASWRCLLGAECSFSQECLDFLHSPHFPLFATHTFHANSGRKAWIATYISFFFFFFQPNFKQTPPLCTHIPLPENRRMGII